MTQVRYYKVGGCVRDGLLGIKSKDIDFSVEAPSYKDMVDSILQRGGRIYFEKPQYLTVKARLGNDDADFVLCRKDGSYYDGRRPESVEMGTIQDDLARRDFTMNAIAYDMEKDIFIDPFNGHQDIINRTIRCVGDTETRFREDALRMLRAIRFSIVKGFKIHSNIREALQNPDLASTITKVSHDRIKDELNKCFAHDTDQTLRMLAYYNSFRDAIFQDKKLSLEATLKQR